MRNGNKNSNPTILEKLKYNILWILKSLNANFLTSSNKTKYGKNLKEIKKGKKQAVDHSSCLNLYN